MKKIFLPILTALIMASCGSSVPATQYDIEGTVNNPELEGETVKLYIPGMRDLDISTTIVDGKFAFKGEFDTRQLMQVRVANMVVYAATEADKVLINIDQEEAKVVEGSESIIINENRAVYDKMQQDAMAKAKEEGADPTEIYDKYMVELKAKTLQDAKNNSGNMAGAYAVLRLLSGVEEPRTVATIDSLIAIAPLAADCAYIVNEKKTISYLEKTQAGSMFVDFEAQDIEGEAIKFSDYVGKGNYVLVDFWASWCGPCIREMPYIRENYDKYKDQGLVVLGVNVWDKKDAFLEAVEKENMTWSIMYASDNNDATTFYGISGIPTLILFAPDGTIVDRGIRGARTGEVLEEIYSK